MKVEQFLIGLLIFSLFMVTGSMIFFNTANEYNQNPDMSLFDGAEDESGTYAILGNISDDIAAPSNSRLLGEDSTDIAEDSADVSLIAGAFRVLKLIPNSFRLITNIIQDIAVAMHLPAFFVTFMLAVFLISIIFAIIYMIWRMR